MKYVWIRRWHIARAYGRASNGVPEVDTLCGRRTYREWQEREEGVLTMLLNNTLCLTCCRRARRFNWVR